MTDVEPQKESLIDWLMNNIGKALQTVMTLLLMSAITALGSLYVDFKLLSLEVSSLKKDIIPSIQDQIKTLSSTVEFNRRGIEQNLMNFERDYYKERNNKTGGSQ